MLPYTICRVLLDMALTKQDKNPLNDGVRELTGKKVISFGKKYSFERVKEASRKLGITINDLMTTALSMALKRYFVLKGDTKTDMVNIVLPVNIRWAPYDTFDSVKLENKFAPMLVKLPLISDATEAMPKIKKVCNTLKSKFPDVYASYFLGMVFGSILPA